VSDVPPNRWESLPPGTSRYAEVFADLIARGEDIDGEARLVDVLAPRKARVLDAGAGVGRVAAALARRGHDVTAVEKDPDLVAKSREWFPEVPVVQADILELSPRMLEAQGRPTSYDVVVVVGNVMIYLAEHTEARALRTLAELLAPGGRILVGFNPVKGPPHSRDYPVADFHGHVTECGLVVQHEFGGYDLATVGEEYEVAVLTRRASSSPDDDWASRGGQDVHGLGGDRSGD
jgi:SAM-dependent methyltransferase